MPTRANSANPNGPTPASSALSAKITFTGLPVSSSSDPALAANTIGISSRDGFSCCRTATITAIGSSAATAPVRLIIAVRPAASSMVNTSSRRLLSPASAISRWPIQAVTPVESRPSLTTNRAAIITTVESPNPAMASVKLEHPEGEQGQRRADGDDLDRQPVPHEQADHDGQHDQGDGGVAHDEHPAYVMKDPSTGSAGRGQRFAG